MTEKQARELISQLRKLNYTMDKIFQVQFNEMNRKATLEQPKAAK